MFKAIISNFSVRFFAAIFNLLIAICISHYLGAAGKGEQSIILASITIILLVDNLIGGASVIYLASRTGTKNLITTAYSWAFFVSSCCYLILSSIPWIEQKNVIAISLISGLNSIISINSSILVGKEKIQRSNLLSFCIPFLTLSVILSQLILHTTKNIDIYLNSLYIAYSSTLLLSLFLIKKELKREDSLEINELPNTFKILLFYGFQNQIAHIFQLLSFRLSYFLLENNHGQKAVGIYSNGLSIIESIWLITSSISLYQYSRISNSNDKEYSLKLTEKLTKLGLLLAFISLFVALFIPSEFYIWLFGKEFGELSVIIRLMAPGIWIFNYALILGHYFSGVGKYYVNAIASGCGFFITLVLSFFIFPKMTIYDAALTAVISYFTTSLVVIYFYLKEGGKFVVFPTIGEIKEFTDQLILKRS
jgi:O-antigen/teichoic acid export membrane protein